MRQFDEAAQIARRLQSPCGLLVVLSGPSGAGKDTVRAELVRRGLPYHFALTATTRPPRAGEHDGVDYHFLSRARFEDLIATGGLMEYEQYENGHYYGSPKADVREALRAGGVVVMRTDVRGAVSIKRLVPGAITIMVYTASLEALRRRLLARRTETPESLERRMALASDELRRVDEFDYAVLNDDGALDRAVDQTEAIITAERCRVGRPASVVE
jgi:guanylate kinase